MNELKELLDAIEKRAEAATFENWGRIARADVPALVKALRRAVRGLTILDGRGTLTEVA